MLSQMFERRNKRVEREAELRIMGDGKRSTKRPSFAQLVGICILVAATPCASAQTQHQAGTNQSAEDIVVTAQRSGIPVWRVAGPGSVVVLIGSIGSVSPGTKWNPSALDAALAQSDRVLFPGSMRVNVGLFSAIGAIGKWRSQATLPTGTTLQGLTTPEQWARLVNLRSRGVLKPGFERTHPFHLAMALLERAPRDRRKFEPGVDMCVRRSSKEQGQGSARRERQARECDGRILRLRASRARGMPHEGGGRAGSGGSGSTSSHRDT